MVLSVFGSLASNVNPGDTKTSSTLQSAMPPDSWMHSNYLHPSHIVAALQVSLQAHNAKDFTYHNGESPATRMDIKTQLPVHQIEFP